MSALLRLIAIKTNFDCTFTAITAHWQLNVYMCASGTSILTAQVLLSIAGVVQTAAAMNM